MADIEGLNDNMVDETSPFVQPAEPSAAEAQAAIIDEFGVFSDWTERYQYLIDLGRGLPELSPEHRVESNRITGCQSQVWIVSQESAGRLFFGGGSDSAIVAGLSALLLRVYSGRTASEILATEPQFIEATGLSAHLSPTRSGGLASMLQRIRGVAAASN
jgi:cysteine desulfuration protein SufE